MAYIHAAERGRLRTNNNHKKSKEDRFRKQCAAKRRRLSKGKRVDSDQEEIKVLMISEDVSTASVMLDRLRKNMGQRFETHFIQDPLKALQAMDRYRPDVVVAENWYGRSDKDYWDVMLPIFNFHPETKVVVVLEQQDRGRELPQAPWYFNNAFVIMRILKENGPLGPF